MKLVTIILIIPASFIIIYFSGYRINITKSIPIGVYRTVNKAADKYDYVIFCPPENEIFKEARSRDYIDIGFCPGSYGFLMKKIVATKGDHVTISTDGVFINGKFLPLSVPLHRDLQGRVMNKIAINKVLSDSEVLLMSDVSKTSFDARYFGIIDKKNIVSVVKPVFIFNEEKK
ncbi:conjugative transfer signal peptidase TraF [Gilliamella sp. HK2]|jgi:conjugative transfer signal peptidase TraF|uniref:conjugative transfer signal peptidase TraF n=1 Tax=unclassified Gilliamella TaxID=2685620 RepID=UPI00080DB576|nr:conjugative transfer signal peptidase TraF [Gilliamella apicola]OCG28966.1 conjugative transfer signal peptidase TraF [Gilliamella apicola]OCG31436.1 conjugative transfer signal peptidase TraF [Gilliamella apicola]